MLKHLHIRNYALIDQLDIEFGRGFSVITGETGAGKSIILGAIGLLLGQRADAKAIKTGEKRCVIEAEFCTSQSAVSQFLTANDFEQEGDICTIRREVSQTGKSRAFINDTPATVAQLRELGDQLVDIHSQHQNLLLSRENFQLRALDTVAKNAPLLEAYSASFGLYKATQRELAKVRKAWEEEQREQDYMQFQFSQLEEAKLREGEQEELEQRQRSLEHAEETKSQLFSVSDTFNKEETGVLDGLLRAQRRLEGIAAYCPEVEELARRVESCKIELKDVAAEVDDKLEEAESDPQALEKVVERLDLIYDLLRKHHTDSVQDLLRLREELRQKLHLIDRRESEISELEGRLQTEERELLRCASALSASRRKAARELEQGMLARLKDLGMPNIQFEARVTEAQEPTQQGKDNVTFSFSANKNTPLQPIAQVASGGEIARVMLALKALISKATQLPAVIFDEIDTGVSGRIAEQMAKLMREMSEGEERQVISITHLPQIAALGEHHYRVFKEESSLGSASRIALLTREERIEELAHLLSGSTVTQAAIDNAKTLLSNA
ncbi:MAG: DNA repair protein RecN [Prevotellaceae bacterium]|nr:DNA repair protein RecN [Prevotellaceae bacterium]